MGSSRYSPTTGIDSAKPAARTPGALGVNDAGDPHRETLGDTPGPLGSKDHADPDLKTRLLVLTPEAVRLAFMKALKSRKLFSTNSMNFVDVPQEKQLFEGGHLVFTTFQIYLSGPGTSGVLYRLLPARAELKEKSSQGWKPENKLEGAHFMILGAVQAVPAGTGQGAIRITPRVVKVETGEILVASKADDAYSRAGLERAADAALAGLKIKLNPYVQHVAIEVPQAPQPL